MMKGKLQSIAPRVRGYRIPCRVFFAVAAAVILSAGCSSSSGGGDDNGDPTPGYETYTTSGSDLVLSIPDSLNVRQEDVIEIHSAADKVPHCYTTNREPVDIVLAEACIAYDDYYLYPQFFPEGLDAIKTVESYVSFLQASDPFSFYLSPEDYAYFISFFQGERAFIGFSVECDGEIVSDRTPLVVADITPFTRAWIDGFQKGDQIIEIDGVSLKGMLLEAVDLLFPTTEEEPVEITVNRNGIEITITTAAEENIGLLLYQDIAYLSVRSFSETTAEEVRLDFIELQAETTGKVDKLILDVRDNGGGSVSGALALVDYLIDKDSGVFPIVTVRGTAGEEETRYLGDYNVYDIGSFNENNFVLLIDENSASASEIVASVLKHYGTAYLMGETTFGKGIGQSLVELIDGSCVVVPSFESLPPSGKSYHLMGVTPDYYLYAVITAFDDDPVLDAAVRYLNAGGVAIAASSEPARKRGVAAPEKRIDPLRETFLERNGSGRYH